jgi:hypothetical protein
MKLGDSIISFLGLLLCAGAWILGSRIPNDIINHVGANFFPSGVIVLLTFAFFVNFIQIMRKKNCKSHKQTRSEVGRFCCILVFCLLYPIGFKWIGFILSTGILTIIMLYLANVRNIGEIILGAAGTPVLVHMLFCHFFDIELPLGVLQKLLQ